MYVLLPVYICVCVCVHKCMISDGRFGFVLTNFSPEYINFSLPSLAVQ